MLSVNGYCIWKLLKVGNGVRRQVLRLLHRRRVQHTTDVRMKPHVLEVEGMIGKAVYSSGD